MHLGAMKIITDVQHIFTELHVAFSGVYFCQKIL